jgi:hypothetical protein
MKNRKMSRAKYMREKCHFPVHARPTDIFRAKKCRLAVHAPPYDIFALSTGEKNVTFRCMHGQPTFFAFKNFVAVAVAVVAAAATLERIRPATRLLAGTVH